jgi:hypothetical protein
MRAIQSGIVIRITRADVLVLRQLCPIISDTSCISVLHAGMVAAAPADYSVPGFRKL